MKFDLEEDEFSFKDESSFMNLNYQMENQQLKNGNSTIGFNEDTIYNKIEKK